MGDKTFHLEVITPDRSAVSGRMTSLQVRASDGRMGVLANHAPLIAMLSVGRLHYRDDKGGDSWLATGDGFIEVADNKVKVLCDFAEFPEEIDVRRAERAQERARERLSHRADPEVDDVRAAAALRRAIVRLKLSGRG
jgi:F-type H+-transporting ATPase subunit epsilon